MRKWLKRGISFFLVPITRWYLQKERNFRYEGISIKVKPGVFHPGLFSSSVFLISYLKKQNLERKTLLELGCGTGLISIFSALQGACVTATDLNDLALENTRANVRANRVDVTLIHSNLFEKISHQLFDWIVINPPYYARAATTPQELAWHCGANFEYFHQLFQTIAPYMHGRTQAIMTLTAGCDLSTIFSIARENNFRLDLVEEKPVFFDGRDFLYRLHLSGQSQL